MTMSYARIALCTMALLCAPLGSTSQAAAMLAADQGSGYAGLILEKVSKTWHAPQYPSDHTVRIQVRIDGDGDVLSCTPVQSSNLALMDKSACAAVRETKKYPPPPYGMPIDVYLTFWTGLPSVGTLGASPEDAAMATQATRNEKQASAATAAAMALARAAEARAAAAAAKGGAKTAKAGTVSPGTSLSSTGTPPATPVTAAESTKPSTKGNAAGTKALAAEPKGTKSKNIPVADSDTPTPKMHAQTFRAESSPPPVQQTKETPPAPAPTAAKPTPVTPTTVPTTAPPEGRVVAPIPAAPTPPPANANASALFKSGQPLSNLVGPKAEEPTKGEARYAHLVRWTIREAMIIPAELPLGVYTFTISIRLSEKGEITKATLSYPSGNTLMDKYAMQGIKRVQALPPPPAKKLQDLHLTFIVQRS